MRRLMLVAAVTLWSCRGTDGANGTNGTNGVNGTDGANGQTSLVRLVTVAAGAECAGGGVRVESGVDTDTDGSLDDAEVTSREVVCSAVTGPRTLVSVRSEPDGANCARGGSAIDTGVDSNGDGALQASEVTDTQYVCNGVAALPALIETTRINAAPCAMGGVRVSVGIDSNQNGVLEASEVSSTSTLCDGAGGDAGVSVASLVRTSVEAAGANCAAGGQRLEFGLDANGNGALDAGEVTSTAYVCNGAGGATGNTGAPGARSLVSITAEPAGTNCANGGRRVQSGLDTNGDNTLQAVEVTQTSYVCDGAAGLSTLVTQASEPSGANCPSGGTVVRSGLDTNRNGTLDAGEVTSTSYVCQAGQSFPTRWAASWLTQLDTGEIPTGVWFPTQRDTRLFKVRNDTRLKVTVTDNLRGGYGAMGATTATYAVLANGAWINCETGVHHNVAAHVQTNVHHPLSMVCVIEPSVAGLYEFESFAISSAGTAYVGWLTSSAQVLVEEMNDTRYALSRATTGTAATSSDWVATPHTLTYVKQSASTVLKLSMSDTLRAGIGAGGEGRVMVRQDGLDTTCHFKSYDYQGGQSGNSHAPFVLTCVLPNVSAGSHTYTVWLSAGSPEAYLGALTGNRLLLVEEKEPSGLTYVNGPSASGDITAGANTQVAGRSLTVNIATAGVYKLTYSDTFRPGGTCNPAVGSFTLYNNGTELPLTGAMHFGADNAVQDHYRAINMVWTLGLVPGSYTFTIWANAPCGANSFGWERGQVVMLLEPL